MWQKGDRRAAGIASQAQLSYEIAIDLVRVGLGGNEP